MKEKDQGDCQCEQEESTMPIYGGLPQFIGVKKIGAEPMDLWDFQCNVKKMKEPDSKNGPGYKVIYEDDYVSWSPKNVFEKAYRPTDGLNFGLAIEALKMGRKVARNGWNGKGMYLTLRNGYPVNGHLNADDVNGPLEVMVGEIPSIPMHKGGQMLSHILMKTAGDSKSWGKGYNDYVPWLASQTDMLSDDWEIVG